MEGERVAGKKVKTQNPEEKGQGPTMEIVKGSCGLEETSAEYRKGVIYGKIASSCAHKPLGEKGELAQPLRGKEVIELVKKRRGDKKKLNEVEGKEGVSNRWL